MGYKVSIVIPVHNEEQNIPLLYQTLKHHTEEICSSYEIIFIDDGSTDNTGNILEKLQKSNKNVSFFRMNKRSGQTNALVKGFALAKNEFIITMDADMEHNPCYIKKFLQKIDEGYDAVIGWRKEREPKRLYRMVSSYLGNRIVNFLFHANFKDVASPFRVFKKNLIEGEKIYNGYHRFLPLIFKGDVKIYEFPIKLEKRRYGKSRYNFLKIFECIISIVFLLFFDKEYKKESNKNFNPRKILKLGL